MTDPFPKASIGVALIQNEKDEPLWVWDDEWGCFALPMSRVRVGPSEAESPAQAATRAAARVLGVPVTLGQDKTLEPRPFVSGRDMVWRQYRYRVFKVQAHADFAERITLARPHLWLPAYRTLDTDYEPVSRSSRWIVSTLLADGLLPCRSQHTGVLVLTRTHHGQKQFLLRHEPKWGYALPTKRRAAGESYAQAAERAAQQELGLKPNSLPLHPAEEPVLTMRDVSRSEMTDTFYCHGVFEAAVPDDIRFVSSQPLAWVDAKTVVAGRLADRTGVDGQKLPDDKVSPTAVHILQELDHVPFLDLSLVTP